VTSADCAATPATKICSAAGKCVACTTNTDCAAPTPLCDQQRDVNACVQCIHDKDCGANGSCNNGTCK
jgi:hypothetical protein